MLKKCTQLKKLHELSNSILFDNFWAAFVPPKNPPEFLIRLLFNIFRVPIHENNGNFKKTALENQKMKKNMMFQLFCGDCDNCVLQNCFYRHKQHYLTTNSFVVGNFYWSDSLKLLKSWQSCKKELESSRFWSFCFFGRDLCPFPWITAFVTWEMGPWQQMFALLNVFNLLSH